jgi:hypothetical protein
MRLDHPENSNLSFLISDRCRSTLRTVKQLMEGRRKMKDSQFLIDVQTEGRIKQLQEDILRMLAVRFNTSVPKDIATTVSQNEDRPTLARWLDATATAGSLADFRKVLQE